MTTQLDCVLFCHRITHLAFANLTRAAKTRLVMLASSPACWLLPVETSTARRIQDAGQTAHAHRASATVILMAEKNALLYSRICAMEFQMRMERFGHLKDATETIRIIQTFRCTIELCIVIRSSALPREELMEDATVK